MTDPKDHFDALLEAMLTKPGPEAADAEDHDAAQSGSDDAD